MNTKKKENLGKVTEIVNEKGIKPWKIWIVPLLLWLILIIFDLTWNYHIIDRSMMNLARDSGSSFFKQVEIARIWNARHGGVYALITEDNQPNPYLKVPYRDIVTTDGLELTMINPAYMTRQIAEIAKEKNNIVFHITSLKPIRPENGADEWETIALKEFEKDKPEKIEFIDNEFEKSFKYMAPLFVKKACIKCHSQHGYKVGDIRGGISVTIPAKQFLATSSHQKLNQIFLHIGVFFIGICCIFYFRICSHQHWFNLEESNKQLLHAGKLAAIGKLSASIVHEFNNPICGIRNVLDIIGKKSTTGSLSKEEKELVDMAIKECDRVSGLINRLHDFHSPSQGVKSFVNINETIHDIELIYKKKLQHRRIVLERSYAENIPQIKVVPDQIKQVILNLIQNAEDSIQGEKGQISLRTEYDNDNIYIRIKDTGYGIPKGDINSIFEPFFTTKSESKGTGLGLSVCHGIIRRHNGAIDVDSSVGEGTTFSITLPIKGV